VRRSSTPTGAAPLAYGSAEQRRRGGGQAPDTRRTSGRRYSYDDPLATVIVVSEDGPFRAHNGAVLGRSPNDD
jgi:hypothetical protein